METLETLLKMARDLSNWGKWGPDDQRGTTNYIGSAAVLRGLQAARRGRVFNLGIPLGHSGPQTTGVSGRFNPLHYMLRTGGDEATGAMVRNYYGGRDGEVRSLDDVLVLPLQSVTQWDALAHIAHRGVMYNGTPITAVTSWGAERLGIEQQAQGIVSRGILLDIARLHHQEWLEPGTGIGPEDLDAFLSQAGLTTSPGDVLLVRTGAMARAKRHGWGDYAGGPAPGLNVACLPWLSQHEISAVATDTWGVEVRPSEVEDVPIPFHLVAIAYMGLTLGEIWDLEALAESSAEDGQYDGLLCAPPLPVTGGIGSPLNPLFIK